MTPHHNIIRKRIAHLSLLLMVFFILGGNSSHAQEPGLKPNPKRVESSDPHTRIIQQSIALMEQSEWQKTLGLLNPLIEKNKDTGLKKHGAKFATSYYYKGLCLLKLAQQKTALEKKTATELFKTSIQSLNECNAVNPPNDPTNTYRVKSLLLRGNAQQALRQYSQAIASYQQFLLERNAALDPYHLSDFNINLAICLWKNQEKTPAETAKAIDLLQQSLLYTGRNKPSPRAVITALHTLTDIAIHDTDPGLIPATIQHVLTTRPANLIFSPDTDVQILTPLSKLILDTAQKNLPLASLHLTTLIPGITEHTAELELPATLTEEIPPSEKLTPNQATKNTIAIALQSRSLTFQKSNNLQKAIRLYTLLLEKYPDTPHQPENLYNLTRLTAQTGAPADATIAITRAHQFLETYPDHPLKNSTLIILLNTHYHNQQYPEALRLAEQTLTNLDNTSTDPDTRKLLDTASFIRAASHYYLGNFTTAAPLLTTHQTTHPDSPHQADTTYLTAAIQNQLLNWDTSIPLLRKFITQQNLNTQKEPSIYTPFASYDIAYAQYSQRQLHSTILSLIPFTLDIPFTDTFRKEHYTTSHITPQASILLGNTHLLLGERDTAIAHYQTAIQQATDNGNIAARDEAYYLLIHLLGQPLWDGLTNHRLPETIPYYLHFTSLENSQQSPYYTQILTSAITALVKANPTEPAYTLLAKNLFLHNSTPNTPGIEPALKTYLYYLRKDEKTTEQILRHLTEDIETTPSAYHQTLLITAQIETLEFASRRKPEDNNIQSQISKLYQDLISQYRAEDLDNFTRLKIANHLTQKNNLTEANSYYQAIIDSPSSIRKTEARLGLAIQLASSATPAEKQTAKTQLTEILTNPFTPPAPRATAHHHILILLEQEENWPELETSAIAYLKYPASIKIHSLSVRKQLALAYERQEKINDAIAAYTYIWSITFSNIPNSAPALDRACQLLWERNNPAKPGINAGKSDRQLAYETAYKYIRKTKDHYAQRKENLPPAAIQTWQHIKTNATKTYPQDSQVKPFHGQP